jgi:hypothetical protein
MGSHLVVFCSTHAVRLHCVGSRRLRRYAVWCDVTMDLTISDVMRVPLICYHNLVPLRGTFFTCFHRLCTHILPVYHLQ